MYRWVDHTAELELRIEADSEEGVFGEARAALAELLGERTRDEPSHQRATREIAVAAPDRPALLAEWLSELVYLAEAEGLIPETLERLGLQGTALEATVTGPLAFPPHLVKAVTYHRLDMWEEDETWRARVILDV
ncbi:MAG TPA: archease [Solirubrobacterales bacterium]|nr:archease [Solirubrobacterales bacterium]